MDQPAAMKYPAQLFGKITWIPPDGSIVSVSDVKAVLRSPDEIAFDCRDDSDPTWPMSYTVTLNRTTEDSFKGSFKCTRQGIPPGEVKCRWYSSSTGCALIGTWVEEKKTFRWFAELFYPSNDGSLGQSSGKE